MGGGVFVIGFQNPRDARMDTIGPDDEVGRYIDHASVGSGDLRAANAIPGSPNEIDHAVAVDHLGTGSQRGIDEHRVQEGPTRSVQSVDTVQRLDLDFDGLVAVMESRLPERGSLGRPDGIQQAPAVQLEHSAPHQRVSRQSVTSTAGRVDHEDS